MGEQEKNKEQEQRRAERLEFQRRYFPYYNLGPNLFQFDEELEEIRKEEEQKNPASMQE